MDGNSQPSVSMLLDARCPGVLAHGGCCMHARVLSVCLRTVATVCWAASARTRIHVLSVLYVGMAPRAWQAYTPSVLLLCRRNQ